MREATVRRVINQDPVVITLKRTGRVREGGGFKKFQDELGPYTVLIAERGIGANPQRNVTAVGERASDAGWAMLTGPEVDSLAGGIGEEVEETFTAPHGTFRLRDKRPIRHAGATTGYQFGLEKVA